MKEEEWEDEESLMMGVKERKEVTLREVEEVVAFAMNFAEQVKSTHYEEEGEEVEEVIPSGQNQDGNSGSSDSLSYLSLLSIHQIRLLIYHNQSQFLFDFCLFNPFFF